MLSDYELQQIARYIREQCKEDLRDLLKQQLKEAAFQLTLFADRMNDK